jgi:hypothetical protein
MLECLTKDHHKEEIEMLTPYLTVQWEYLPQRVIMGAQKWFRARGYKVVEHYQQKNNASTQRHIVCEFFNEDKTFVL